MPLTSAQLAEVNAWRAEQIPVNADEITKRRYTPLKESPGLRFLRYGKNKDGWWNFEMMAQQCEGHCVWHLFC